MNVLTVPRTVAGLEYKALRLPATVGASLVGRLDEESRIRLAFEKALGSVDAAVGRFLADEELTRRGTALSRRAEILETAVVLEEKAELRKAQAAQELKEKKAAAGEQRRNADQEKAEETRRLREQEKAAKKAASVEAAAKERAAAEAIRAEAAANLEAERDRVAAAEAAIEKRVEERTAAPKAQLEQAVKRKSNADAERAAADRLSELAQAEKARRTSEK